MSHPHGESLFTPPSGGQSQTLILTAGNSTGFLHSHKQGKERITAKRFKSAHAALDWCLAHGANLLLFHAADAARN